MHPVFDIIPRQNFAPLSAPKASVFLDLLMRLWRESHGTTGMISHATVSRIALDMAMDPSTANALNEINDDRVGTAPANRVAADAIRQLVDWEWLSPQNDTTFGTEYLFSPGGSLLLDFLNTIQEGAHDSVVTAVLRIHDALKQAAEADEDRHFRVYEAERTTDQFISDLNTIRLQLTALNNRLHSELRRHEIFDVLFGEVHSRALELLHQLSSTYHIGRYRTAINDYVHALLQPDMLQRLAADEQRGHPNHPAAEYIPRLESALVRIQDGLDFAKKELLDPLLAFEGRLTRRADVLYRATQMDSRTVRQHLHQLARLVLGHGMTLPEDFFQLEIPELPPQGHLPHITRIVRTFTPDKAQGPRLTKAELQAAEEAALNSARQWFGPEAANAYLAEQLGDRNSLRASELADLPVPAFHLVTSLWEWRALLHYDLTTLPDPARVTVGNARFDDFSITPHHPNGAGGATS